jgi:molybdenum-dependent DNA-binding transcriptional regulator ModE
MPSRLAGKTRRDLAQAIVECGGIARAAAHLGVSQRTFTNRCDTLEFTASDRRALQRDGAASLDAIGGS